MLDVMYVLVTLAFFALMLLFVRACENLGRDGSSERERQ
jgi:hypothetical protein